MNIESSGIDNVKIHIRSLIKRRVLFVVTAILITTAAIIVSYLLPKKYEAKSTVFIERSVISDLVKGIAITPSMEDRLRVMIYSMKSRNLLVRVIKALDMDLDMENQAELEKMVANLQDNTSIEVKKGREGMDLFIIKYRDKDPKFARDYINTVVKLYIEGELSGKRDEAYGANTFLSDQIGFFKSKLDKTDEEILNFRKEKGIFVSTDERKIVSEIKNAEDKREELASLKMELEAKQNSIAKQLKDGNAYVIAGPEGIAPVSALQQQLNSLLINYTEDYPEVIRVRAEIDASNKASERATEGSDASQDVGSAMSINPVYQDLNTELVKVKSELAAIEAKAAYLEKLIESKKSYLRDIPTEKKKLADMERQKALDSKIYGELILRLGQSEVSKQMEVQDKGATFNIIDPAVLPIKHVSPNRVGIIILGILAGLAGGFGLVFLLDGMDSSIKTAGALKTLGFPVLAEIPAISNAEDIARERKKNIVLFSSAGVYMFFVLIIIVLEILELTYIDRFVTKLIM